MAIVLALALALGAAATLASAADDSVVDPTRRGSITFHKYLVDTRAQNSEEQQEGEAPPTPPSGGTPLAGIEFVVTPLTENVAGTFTYNNVNYIKGTPLAVIQTNASGISVYSNLPVGSYLVHENADARVSSSVADFVVSIPTTYKNSSTGESYLEYDIDVYPKNESLSIDKEVETSPGSSSPQAPVAVGDMVHWIITSTIPGDINETGVDYSVIDTMTTGLGYAGSLTATATGVAKTDLLLAAGTDYTLTAPSVGFDGGVWKLTLTSVGRAKVEGYQLLSVRFATTILPTAASGQYINNHAGLEYTNEFGEDITRDTPGDPDTPNPDDPYVYFGGIHIHKTDSLTDADLSGAQFSLVLKTSANYQNDYSTNGYFTFVNESNASATTVTTKADGSALIKGLPVGNTASGDTTATAHREYWLVEVNAPSGYRLLGAPKIVDVYFDTVDIPLDVPNVEGFEFPLAGGKGILYFIVAGVVVLGLAGVLIVSKKKTVRQA
jgi:fimbrial isopeptide formation D2 family protein